MSSHHVACGSVVLMEAVAQGVSLATEAAHTVVPEAVPIALSLIAGVFTASRWVDPFFAPSAVDEAAVGDAESPAL
jgi:hypothetical protein